ncbi:MAG: hypothetical protein ACEPOW_06930 [Bacteroidales bacterium]
MKKLIRNGKSLCCLLVVLLIAFSSCSKRNHSPGARASRKAKSRSSIGAHSAIGTKVRKQWIIKDSRRGALGAQKYAKKPRR